MVAEADLGPELLVPPATPDIGRKPPAQSAVDGCSSRSAPPAPASVGLWEVDKHGFFCVPPSIGEQRQSAPEEGQDCAANTEASSPEESASSDDEIAPPGECSVPTATSPGATLISTMTPDKVENTPWKKPKKRSTKGLTRLRLNKDKRFKSLHKTPVTKGNAKKSAKRKLDFDSPEIITASFSRAMLMDNLRCLAKINNLSNELRSNNGKKRKTSGVMAMVPYQNAPIDSPCSALVPFGNSAQLAMVPYLNRRKKVRAKLLGITPETKRVYDVLMKWDEIDSESFEGLDIGSGPEWDKIRLEYKKHVHSFIAIVKDLFGPREFSQWGGSVIDSVVGTFLTQNVADHLSSNAFMVLAAKFPMNKGSGNAEESSHVPLIKENLNLNKASSSNSISSAFSKPADCEEVGYSEEVKGQYGEEYKTIIENFLAIIQENDISTWGKDDLLNLVKDKSSNSVCSETTLRKFIASLRLEDTAHWDKLRGEACRKGYDNRSETRITDKVDWEAVLHAPLIEVAKCIAGRGQHYLLALRIQAFLARIKKDHGSFDLDWLKYVPRESAKNYLLSVNGLGAKSVDCIRLLSLKQKAFPVDVNVSRIVTRLEWVELECSPEEFHLVDLYPLMKDIQTYLWPRLCTIGKEKLYELHCLMITFGKVICTKAAPNCKACPFRARCRYYKSNLARSLLPPAEESVHGPGEEQTSMVTSERLLLPNGSCTPGHLVCQNQIKESKTAGRVPTRNCEPIIEVPPSPECEHEALDEQEQCLDIEDMMSDGEQYDAKINLCSYKPLVSIGCWTPNRGKDLVLSNSHHTSYQSPKLKNPGRLRTEHHAYVLPDDHVILEEFEKRVPEDPCPYLLVVIPCPDDEVVKGTMLADQGQEQDQDGDSAITLTLSSNAPDDHAFDGSVNQANHDLELPLVPFAEPNAGGQIPAAQNDMVIGRAIIPEFIHQPQDFPALMDSDIHQPMIEKLHITSEGTDIWQQHFMPKNDSSDAVSIPGPWIDFFTVMLISPDNFAWARKVLLSNMWNIFASTSDVSRQFALPDSCPSKVAPNCKLTARVSEASQGFSTPQASRYVNSPEELPMSTSAIRVKRSMKPPIVVTQVRRSDRLKDKNGGFKHNTCINKHCLACASKAQRSTRRSAAKPKLKNTKKDNDATPTKKQK